MFLTPAHCGCCKLSLCSTPGFSFLTNKIPPSPIWALQPLHKAYSTCSTFQPRWRNPSIYGAAQVEFSIVECLPQPTNWPPFLFWSLSFSSFALSTQYETNIPQQLFLLFLYISYNKLFFFFCTRVSEFISWLPFFPLPCLSYLLIHLSHIFLGIICVTSLARSLKETPKPLGIHVEVQPTCRGNWAINRWFTPNR